MRENLFRGKNEYRGWIYGDLRNYEKSGAKAIFSHELLHRIEVIPETVGQFTGLTDKNGKKIFEGDIVNVCDEVFGSPFCYGITGKIVYDECAFFIQPENVMDTQWLFNECAIYEIIGNIHDNPEILKGDETE